MLCDVITVLIIQGAIELVHDVEWCGIEFLNSKNEADGDNCLLAARKFLEGVHLIVVGELFRGLSWITFLNFAVEVYSGLDLFKRLLADQQILTLFVGTFILITLKLQVGFATSHDF